VDLPPISSDRYGAVGLPGAIFASYSPDNPGLVTMELPVYTQDDNSGPTWSLEGVEKQYARWVEIYSDVYLQLPAKSGFLL
jgi:hypothetical protein